MCFGSVHLQYRVNLNSIKFDCELTSIWIKFVMIDNKNIHSVNFNTIESRIQVKY